ncbi:MAG: ferrous iron transport protein A [Bacteroidetes bacterium]|nr:ferrous iron transport protein A [Bacteroidota bacterium]MBU1423472.1 ferrous iron transport protein A [Bacteroidota bacterium]MBU2636414.1 ferrous iron transport protein A [Bacteroidota bacterium]
MNQNNTNENKFFLTDMEENQEGIIISVLGGRMATKRLADLGLTPKTEIKVFKKAPFSGPVMIEVRGSKLIIGLGLASKILVKLK